MDQSQNQNEEFVVDLAGVSTGIELVPAGDYRVKLTNSSTYRNPKGQPTFRIIVTVVQPEEFAGKVLRPYSSTLLPEYMGFFKRVVAAFGAPPDILERRGIRANAILMELRGNEADVNVAMDQYEGRPQNKLYFYMPGELEQRHSLTSGNSWEAPPESNPIAAS